MLFFFLEKELPNGFPQIIQNPGMKVVEKSRNAVLVCEGAGDPNPTITWIKDTMPVDLKANPRLSLMKQGKLRGKAEVPGRLNGFCLDTTLATKKSSYRYLKCSCFV